MCFLKVSENNQIKQPFYNTNVIEWKKGIGQVVVTLSIIVAAAGALSLIASTGVLPNAMVIVGDPGAILMIAGGTIAAVATGILLKKCNAAPAYVFSNENSEDLSTDVFEIESESGSTLSLDEVTLDGLETEEEMRVSFKGNILTLFNSKKIPKETSLPKLSEEQKALVEAAYHFLWDKKTQKVEGFKEIASGGEHNCFTLDQIPGRIFKVATMREISWSHYLDYETKVKNARAFIRKHNLYFLHVPNCQVVKIRDKVLNDQRLLIVEERLDLETNHSALMQWALEQKELTDAMKELFKQFLFFVCKRRFADVKSNNAPLTKQGRVGLFDVDRNSAMTGLFYAQPEVKGFSLLGEEEIQIPHHGFFSFLREEWLEEFKTLAQENFYSFGRRKIEEHFEKREEALRERAEKRSEKRRMHRAFLEEMGIRYTAQQIDSRGFDIDLDEKERDFAFTIIEHANEMLRDRQGIDIVKGRTLNIFRLNLMLLSEDEDQFDIDRIINALCDAKLIFSYRKASNPARYIIKL